MDAAALNRATLGRLLYLIGAMLVTIPLTDALAAVLPARPGAAEWRFGATGLLSGALMTPLLGCFAVLAAATLLEHVRVLRIGAWVLIGVPALLFVAAGVLLLDAVQLRAQVEATMRPAFFGAAAKAALKLLLGAGVALVLGLSSRRMAARLLPPPRPPSREVPTLVRSEDGS
jgi:hypothetical protein